MGKKNRGVNGDSTPAWAVNQAVSLREETSRRTYVNEASLLRVKHLQRLAAWTGTEVGVGLIGVLLGCHLATSAEALGVLLGVATFLCQMCKTVLKPGFNCTVCIKNKRNKTKRRKKSNCCQNSVTWACHFCGDQNLILGSGKGIVKSLLSSIEQGSMGLDCRTLRLHNRNRRTQERKEILDNSQVAILQVDLSSRSCQSTGESGEHGERLRRKLPGDCKMDGGVTCSMVEPIHSAGSAFQEDSIHKLVLENTNDGQMHETEAISSRNVEACESNATLEIEFSAGSTFVTPQKPKLSKLTDPKYSAETFMTRIAVSKKGDTSGPVTGITFASYSKSTPNDSQKNAKSAGSGSAHVSGSSRKRARKWWTTRKQIAEKDELERKEKMGNFVIPFFMQ